MRHEENVVESTERFHHAQVRGEGVPAWSVEAFKESTVSICAECCALASGAVKCVDWHPVGRWGLPAGWSWMGYAGLSTGRGTLDCQCLGTGQGMAGWRWPAT